MAEFKGPEGTGPGQSDGPAGRDDDLVRRRRELEAALSSRRPVGPVEDEGAKTRGMAGFGNALRLSSEFIAGIVVGAGLGWLIDRAADTSPWGLIIFLLLGFVAGVLNVLRSAGLVANVGPGASKDGSGRQGKE
jgi:ATP synthase protein I